MKRVLHVTLARNDNKPDNKILAVFDSIKAHGFHITKASGYIDGGFSATCEWRCIAPNRTRTSLPPVISRNRLEALAALAIDLGQDLKSLDATPPSIRTAKLAIPLTRIDGGHNGMLDTVMVVAKYNFQIQDAVLHAVRYVATLKLIVAFKGRSVDEPAARAAILAKLGVSTLEKAGIWADELMAA
jgi:hypothetical protein